MMRTSFIGALLTAAAVSMATAAEKPASPAPADKGTNARVIVYYFHGTIRCETCLMIEKQARQAIERRFTVELAEARLIFESVNYDQPENAHFLKEYQLPCPSLVLVRQNRGKDEKWKLLDRAWEYAENPVAFKNYVEAEVDKLVPSR